MFVFAAKYMPDNFAGLGIYKLFQDSNTCSSEHLYKVEFPRNIMKKTCRQLFSRQEITYAVDKKSAISMFGHAQLFATFLFSIINSIHPCNATYKGKSWGGTVAFRRYPLNFAGDEEATRRSQKGTNHHFNHATAHSILSDKEKKIKIWRNSFICGK